MLSNITIGQYFPGNSLIHKLDPRMKIVLIFLMMASVFISKSYVGLALGVAVTIVIVALSRINLKTILKGMKPILVIVLITSLLNLFYGTGIPVCIIVCKKNRNGNKDNILFIDASKDFTKGKKQNVLEDEHIQRIYETYRNREDVERFAHVATMDEIAENGFNLNIPRYVDTSEPEPEIDLTEVAGKIQDTNAEIEEVAAELKESFDLLGLEFPF